MREITLDDVTQDAFDEESRVLIDLMRTKYPKLDLRNGTVLRDLLINPDATIGAWFEAQKEEQRQASSLKTLQEREEAGETIDPEDLAAILSNFDMTSSEGVKSKGKVRVNVSENRTYVVADGFEFTTEYTGISFKSDGEFTVSKDGPVMLYDGPSGYFFLIPVTASLAGSDGNIKQGTGLNPKTSFYGFVNAVAADDFSGGSDVENIGSIIARIPQAVSQRGLLTTPSSEGQLRQKFDSGEHPIVAVSAVGYGNPAQIRDIHNAFGIAVGGRVDLYVRNFTEMPVYSDVFEFTKSGASYTCTLNAADLPGVAQVLSVGSDKNSIGSYEFSVSYSADVIDTWHDIKVDNDTIEAANTIWRSVTITVPAASSGLTGSTENLYVEMAKLPEAKELQEYVDNEAVRNVGSDFVVRCPMIVNVSIQATVRRPMGVAFSESKAKSDICNYINTSGFIKRLTRSEIACILQANGATSVPMTDIKMLYGEVADATGEIHKLAGDSLEISEISRPDRLLTPDTCVFVCSPENIEIFQIDN